MNNSLSTDYYTFIGLSSSTQDANELTSSSQISATDVLWVKKQEVVEYIESTIGKGKLEKDVIDIRTRGDLNISDIFGNTALDSKGKCRTRYAGVKDFWLTYSTNLHERPVNLVVKREVLEKLPSSRHFIVTRENVEKV